MTAESVSTDAEFDTQGSDDIQDKGFHVFHCEYSVEVSVGIMISAAASCSFKAQGPLSQAPLATPIICIGEWFTDLQNSRLR